MDLSNTDQVEGTVKEGVGSVIGDDQLKAEGKAQETSGAIQGAVHSVKERVGGTVEVATGKLKQFSGGVTGDEQLQAEGTSQQVVGRVRNVVAKNPAVAAAGIGLALLILVRLIRR